MPKAGGGHRRAEPEEVRAEPASVGAKGFPSTLLAILNEGPSDVVGWSNDGTAVGVFDVER